MTTQPTTYDEGDELTRDYPDLQGGTITETATVQSVTGDGGPGDVLSLDHNGDNMYRIGEDGTLLTGTWNGETSWTKVTEEEA